MQTLAGTLLRPTSPDTCEVVSAGAVTIGPDGKISTVRETKAEGDAVGGDGCWILPGFIDAHLHVPQWRSRGVDGMGIGDWLQKIVYPTEAAMKDAAAAEAIAEDFVSGVVSRGTTTVAAFGSPHAEATDRIFQVFARRGMRAIFGRMLNDRNCPKELCDDADKALDESRELAAKWHAAEDGRLQYAFCPRMPGACSEGLMRGAAALAHMLNCYIQTHVAESLAEMAVVRQDFPEQVDDLDVLAEMGMLAPRTLLGHAIHLNQDERRQLAETGAAVVHCPTANMFLESGLMDYVAHRDSGIRVALGSSVAGGFEPFMPRVAISALQTSKAVKVHGIPRGRYAVPTPAEAWWLLTAGGAAALGLEKRVGRIDAGYEADLLVVRPEPWINALPAEQQASALLYSLEPCQIEHVFIAGRRVGGVKG